MHTKKTPNNLALKYRKFTQGTQEKQHTIQKDKKG